MILPAEMDHLQACFDSAAPKRHQEQEDQCQLVESPVAPRASLSGLFVGEKIGKHAVAKDNDST
jgi:hypothetical protein